MSDAAAQHGHTARPAKTRLPDLVPPAGPSMCGDQPAQAKAFREQALISSPFRGKSLLLRQSCWCAGSDQCGIATEQFSYF